MNKLFSAKIEKLLTGIPLVENLARKKFVSAPFFVGPHEAIAHVLANHPIPARPHTAACDGHR